MAEATLPPWETEAATGLADAEARARIVGELDRNLVVEAAAGAGKTHALVGRIVALVAGGRCRIDEVAAVTFTRKAAGELRGRLLTRLERAHGILDPAVHAAERERIRRALDRFERAFAGTIHAFCVRLLRERPVEAGVDPGFREVDPREEEQLRREAWDDHVDRESEGPSERLRALEARGLDPEDLLPTYRRLCDYPEVGVPRERRPAPDLEEPAARLRRFVARALERVPEEAVEGRHDGLQRSLFAARSFLRTRPLDDPAERARFLEIFASGTGVIQKLWGDRSVGKEVQATFGELAPEAVEAPLRAWREHCYPVAVDFVRPAVERYRDLRRRRGTLNFQDLLLRTAEMLRSHPEVRAHFADRYPRLLVDEFQDTDPLQAEILFLLTGEDREEDDWRRLTPRPGSLFLVGDPKQSIYRFRRADIDVYRFVRDRVRRGGGEVVTLTTSFRSLEPLVAWLNEALEPVFEDHDEDVQPPFAALTPHREDGGGRLRVRKLVHDKVPYDSARPVARQDAGRIARWVRAAVDGTGPTAGLEPVGPGDVLVLLRQRAHLSLYARALEGMGLPYEVSGGGAVSDSEELEALLGMAEAALHPEDGLALVAHLRGPLVGMSDDALYRFRRAGGRWNYRAHAGGGDVPSVPEADRFRAAFEALKGAYALLLSRPPSAALSELLDRTGLLAEAAGREAGSSRAGSLYRVLSLVRGWESEGWEVARVLDELRSLADGEAGEVDEMVLETGREDVVRVMNVHRAKGLQGRVVFLADPLKRSDPDVTSHIERMGGDRPRGHFPAFRPSRWSRTGRPLALPAGWEELEEREARYQAAEEDRLLYVAATRARDLLVVSQYPANDGKGPWTRLYPALEGVPGLEEPAPEDVAAPPAPGDAGPPPDTASLERRWAAAARPGHRIARPSEDVEEITAEGTAGAEGTAAAEGTAGPAEARAFGDAVHAYLRRMVEGRLEAPRPTARFLLEREGLAPERVAAWTEEMMDAAERVRESWFWPRLAGAEPVLCEVPLGRWTEAEEGEGGGIGTLHRGVVDLAFRDADGWVLVDYKTRRGAAAGELDRLAAAYRPQLEAYRGSWEAITGEPVHRAGVFFTGPGAWRDVLARAG